MRRRIHVRPCRFCPRMSHSHVILRVLGSRSCCTRPFLRHCVQASSLNSFIRPLSSATATMSKPRVFFDMTADGKSLGKIVMEV